MVTKWYRQWNNRFWSLNNNVDVSFFFDDEFILLTFAFGVKMIWQIQDMMSVKGISNEKT